MRHSGRMWLIVALVVGSLALSGCAKAAEVEASGEPAADVQPVGETGLSRVTLTADAMQATRLQTVEISKDTSGPPSARGKMVIPITALVYDPSGKTWVYTMPADKTFVRAPIAIRSMDGEYVHLESGPPVGTRVVTVGGSELLGAEYGVGAE
jgi:hypothetical protein